MKNLIVGHRCFPLIPVHLSFPLFVSLLPCHPPLLRQGINRKSHAHQRTKPANPNNICFNSSAETYPSPKRLRMISRTVEIGLRLAKIKKRNRPAIAPATTKKTTSKILSTSVFFFVGRSRTSSISPHEVLRFFCGRKKSCMAFSVSQRTRVFALPIQTLQPAYFRFCPNKPPSSNHIHPPARKIYP